MKLLKSMVLIILCLSMTAVISQSKNKEKEKGFLGIYRTLEKNIILPDGTTAPYGMKIRVMKKSPAEKGGLLHEDIIIGLDGKPFYGKEDEILGNFKKSIEAKNPGDTVSLTILRVVKAGDNKAGIKSVVMDFNAVIESGFDAISRKKEIPENSAIFPELTNYSDDTSKIVQKLVTHFNIIDDYKDLMERLRKDEEWNDLFRLGVISYIHRDPFKIEKITMDFMSAIESAVNSKTQDLYALTTILSEKLDFSTGKFSPMKLKTGISMASHIDQIKKVMKEAKLYRDKAFREFSADDKIFFFNNAHTVLKSFIDNIYLYENDEWDTVKRLIKLSYAIDFGSLARAILISAGIADREYLTGLKADLMKSFNKSPLHSKDDPPGTILHKEVTEFGDIIIGGTGPNRYTGNTAVIIDLGGDDLYEGNAGGTFSIHEPLSFIIDFSGNDRYTAVGEGGIGYGRMGIGMVLDLSGNDTYTAKTCAAGCGIAGAGIIMDFAGDDEYRGSEYMNGVGLWGMGISIDVSGNDRYTAHLFSQGVGLPLGIGLCMDIAGNDTYYAGGKHKSTYGTAGMFSGFSQGAGIGFRGISSGGIGVLLDSGGNDTYEGGEFSLGCGYFYGWGILKDSGNGNDIYHASRYGLSAAAHSGIASFIDDGGDDVYQGNSGVVNSASWDLSVTLFIDRGGNDVYKTGGGFSLGASAHNGVSIFIDSSGRDEYTNGSNPGVAGVNHYHGGTSFSIFIDQGSEGDIYNLKKIDNTLILQGKNGIFLDINGSSSNLLNNEIFNALHFKKQSY